MLFFFLCCCAGALLLGIFVGFAMGCRTRIRRRLWPLQDMPRESHYRRRRP